MKIYCSSWGTIDAKQPGRQIEMIKKAGFDAVFIDLENYMDKKFAADDALSSIRNHCAKAGIACDIVRKQSADTLALLEQGEDIGKMPERRREVFMPDANFRMGDVCLVKNKCINYNGHLVRGKCSDAMEISSYIDKMNAEAGFEKYGFCLDVGICNILGQNMYDFVRTLGKRMKAVIVRDNDGHSDNALLPYTSAERGGPHTDWLNLIRGLREIEFDGALIMDFSRTAAAFPRLLREHLLSMAYSMAEYFQWQISMKTILKRYDSRVLFGAGNMCRNYMKCYGEDFPPLFTCDNNERRWGERFEGLEIKPPSALKDLSPECVIFICNIYYKEIEEQLREMGISNPIAYFNDEYMPSYYFDRLDYWEGETND